MNTVPIHSPANPRVTLGPGTGISLTSATGSADEADILITIQTTEPGRLVMVRGVDSSGQTVIGLKLIRNGGAR